MPKTASPKATVSNEDVVHPASESIGLLMRIGLRGLRAAFKATLARHKIPWSSWYYLRVLWESDGISQRELTQRVGAMQPNTVSTLRTMEKAGLVRIERPESDRRSTKVWLTTKARNLMRRVLPEWADFFRPGFHPWMHDNRHFLKTAPALTEQIVNFTPPAVAAAPKQAAAAH